MRKKDIAELQQKLAYEFNDISLLEEALTHASDEAASARNYERLEFLGDALINLVIADYMFGVYPDCAEGKLTQMKSNVVSGDSLARMGRRLGITDYISLGKGLRKQGIPDSSCHQP